MEDYCREHGLLYGVCGAEEFSELRGELLAKNAALDGFVEQDIEKRVRPELTLPGARSLVVLGLPYGKVLLPPTDGLPRGRVSMGAVGEDYHRVLKGHLEAVAGRLGLVEYRVFVDTGPLVDRAVALRAGLGGPGRQGGVLTPAGLAVFLGYILTTQDLPATSPHRGDACGTCTACQRACPTGALGENGFRPEHCISYLTQKTGILDPEEARQIGGALYGCDVCVLACPRSHRETWPVWEDREAAFPRLEEILTLTEGTFRERFGTTAGGWRGRRVWQRNALIALWNRGEDISAYREHPAKLVREQAGILGEEKNGEATGEK